MSILANIKKVFTGQTSEQVQQNSSHLDQKKSSDQSYIAGIQE